MDTEWTSDDFEPVNRAFLYGDAVKVYFFVRHSKLILAEECYFFLMASMRKMRMNIPLHYTLDFFENIFQEHVINQGIENAIVALMAYRNVTAGLLSKAAVSFYFDVNKVSDVLALGKDYEMDMMKEINVNNNLLSNIRVHCAENTYAEIYAKENELDDVILLNPDKRIARSISGNLLFLQDDVIKIPKQSEGAYISPLMENFVTFLHRQQLVQISEAEMVGFESQKADEILMISDEKGIHAVSKIRNKTFGQIRFAEMIEKWKNSFESH